MPAVTLREGLDVRGAAKREASSSWDESCSGSGGRVDEVESGSGRRRMERTGEEGRLSANTLQGRRKVARS